MKIISFCHLQLDLEDLWLLQVLYLESCIEYVKFWGYPFKLWSSWALEKGSKVCVEQMLWHRSVNI